MHVSSAAKSWQSPGLPGNIFGLPAHVEESPCTYNFVTGSSYRCSSSSKSALPAKEGVGALHPAPMGGIRFKTGSSGKWTDARHASQLERFLSVIAHEDSRLANSSRSSLRCKLDFVDCRSLQDTSIDAALQSCLDQLWGCLQPRGPHDPYDQWQRRLHELEDFVEQHGRVPRRWSTDRKERSLGVWLMNTFSKCGIKGSGATAAQRRSKLLASSSPLIRLRVQKLLDHQPDASFRARCCELKEYLNNYGMLPHQRSNSTAEGESLAAWLRSQRSSIERHQFSPAKEKSRREELSRIHPLVSQFLCAPSRPLMKIRRGHCLELQRFVSQAERLPYSSRSKYESRLYQWMLAQAHKLSLISAEDRSLLLSLHPLLTTFFKRKLAVSQLATSEGEEQTP